MFWGIVIWGNVFYGEIVVIRICEKFFNHIVVVFNLIKTKLISLYNNLNRAGVYLFIFYYFVIIHYCELILKSCSLGSLIRKFCQKILLKMEWEFQ